MSHPELDSRHRVTMSDLPKVAPRLPPSAGNSSKVSCSPPRHLGKVRSSDVCSDSLAPAAPCKTSLALFSAPPAPSRLSQYSPTHSPPRFNSTGSCGIFMPPKWSVVPAFPFALLAPTSCCCRFPLKIKPL